MREAELVTTVSGASQLLLPSSNESSFLLGVVGGAVIVRGAEANGSDLLTMFGLVEFVAVGFGLVMTLPLARPLM